MRGVVVGGWGFGGLGLRKGAGSTAASSAGRVQEEQLERLDREGCLEASVLKSSFCESTRTHSALDLGCIIPGHAP